MDLTDTVWKVLCRHRGESLTLASIVAEAVEVWPRPHLGFGAVNACLDRMIAEGLVFKTHAVPNKASTFSAIIPQPK